MLIKLDSSTITDQNSENFEVNFDRGIPLEKGSEYELALLRASVWYSWHNISSAFGNNTLKYKYSTNSGGSYTDVTITFEDGIYSVDAINNKLASVLETNNHFVTVNGIKQYPITITPNYTTLLVDVNLNQSLVSNTIFQLDFTTSTLRDLLGFNSGVLSTTTSSQNQPDITRGVNTIMIRSSLVEGSYENGKTSNVLYAFSPSGYAIGANINVEPTQRVYLPITERNYISRIRMELVDQQGRLVDTNDNITYLVHLRKRKNI